MSSPWKKQPEDVVDSVLKRAEVSKIARRLQNRLALAQFKTKHGWEDLTLDSIEPKLEEEMRRRRLCDGDVLSDSSSSASDLPYPTKALMSSPLKAPIFSDAIGSSNGSSGHRKRTYFASFDHTASSPSKRFRASPTAHKSFSGHSAWKDSHHLAQSSPIKPRRQQHFTTSGGPDVSFFQHRRMTAALTSPNFAAPDDDDDLLPAHSFNVNNVQSSPPRTPPMQTRSLASKRSKENLDADHGGKTGEEGADLLLYLAASPSPAVKSNRGRMDRLSTPPPKNNKLDLPSSMMTTPGGGNLFPNTPGQGFDFADFVNITPSPAQKPWRTPGPISARTPLSVTRRRLTFEEPLA
ncbi:Transcription factor Nrm1/Whi5 [Metarhizium album ARSEF 1941]|uniref:Transcription factor Nrm1/Whi5 n=1 Tax=Metarhizium album (strain ARSEF 1941) TaxID=1081103 RepID=A0A0B2X5N3_METAS|nr:Transcription factor Nrm1/Whi5 [Metarhizium album ARSEF 1941]KHO01078.1 Transcription factor Nrm1/Whi5 [Metarhizium album ARSEF 1941]